MAEQSVAEQTTPIQPKKLFLSYKWMHYFFTDSSSADYEVLAPLQQRAVWIAVAILLQAANEIPNIAAISALIPFLLILGSFFALWMGIKPARANKTQRSQLDTFFAHWRDNKRTKAKKSTRDTKTLARSGEQGPKLWQRAILVIAFLVTIAGGYECISTVINCLSAPQFSNDGTSLDTNAAILLTQGRNPYTDSNIPELVRRFTIEPNWTTPLRQGQLANRLDYPSMAELQSILNTSLKAGSVPEFEAKVSYPALSFLTLLPFALVQNDNVLPLYLLCYILIVFVAWKSVRRELRPWVLLLSMANVGMWSSTWGGNLDVLYTLFLVVSWLKRDLRWTSAVFLGLAIATKQIAWYFVPFYAIMALRHYGWKEACYRLAITGGVALAINLPFIMWNYQAFFAGVMAPISDPMFPMGVGLVSFSTAHFIPYLPEKVYSLLEYSGFALSLIAYWRTCKERPESAWLFAIMPLFLAWRSLSSYFYCVAFPAFMMLSAKTQPARQHAFSYVNVKAREQASRRIPTSVSI